MFGGFDPYVMMEDSVEMMILIEFSEIYNFQKFY